MTEIDVVFAGVPVSDFTSAVAWYARLFGRPADVVAHDNEVLWRASDKAFVYVLGDRERAGRGTVTLAVSDLDRTVDELEARGLMGAPIEEVGAAGRKARFSDADGNVVNFVEVAR